MSEGRGRSPRPTGLMTCTVREMRAATDLVKGLRKTVADPETGCIDANIIRLLLDRYDNPHEEDDDDES